MHRVARHERVATFGPGARNGPGYETKSDEGARLSFLSTLPFGFYLVGQLCPLKMIQDTRENSRGLSLVIRAGTRMVVKWPTRLPEFRTTSRLHFHDQVVILS